MNDVLVRVSSIEGLGILAAKPFSPGDRIRRVHVVREITPESPLRPELGERYDHCDYPDGKVLLIGYPDRHLNHSCDPNAYLSYAGSDSFIVALRPIPPGAEVTIDYNINISGGTAWPGSRPFPPSTTSGRTRLWRLPAFRPQRSRTSANEALIALKHDAIKGHGC